VKVQVSGGQTRSARSAGHGHREYTHPASQLHPPARGRGCWAEPVALLGALDALSVAVLRAPPPTPPGVLGGVDTADGDSAAYAPNTAP
jgi:hypothetical protein